MTYQHIPVMLGEVIDYLKVETGKNYIDCTLGGAGYTSEIASLIGPEGKLMSIDLDEMAIENAKSVLAEKGIDNVILVNSSFKNLDKAAADNFPSGTLFSGIVFDLGLSSAQLDDEKRGFSFKGERPLNMSFGPDNELSTEEIVNSYSLSRLTEIFKEYGDEKEAQLIAKQIVWKRKRQRIETTADLVAIVEQIKEIKASDKIHLATKIFQALRIETNQEYEVLEEALEKAEKMLAPGGRLVLVSFHSGEDRIVKNFFRDRGKKSFKILTKKPVLASESEIHRNPRSRSAKLRAVEKI